MSEVGTVKWFDPQQGYGFIVTADGEVFVHCTPNSCKSFYQMYVWAGEQMTPRWLGHVSDRP